jgi:hypothetical protein
MNGKEVAYSHGNTRAMNRASHQRLSETSRVVSRGAEEYPDARFWGGIITAGEIP